MNDILIVKLKILNTFIKSRDLINVGNVHQIWIQKVDECLILINYLRDSHHKTFATVTKVHVNQTNTIFSILKKNYLLFYGFLQNN